MLPSIRSVLIAIIAAIGLLVGAFGLIATFRVAQESRSGSLRAEFALRSDAAVAANSEPLTVAAAENPPPLEAIPVRPVTIVNAPDIPPPVVAPAPQIEAEAGEPLTSSEPLPTEQRSGETRSIEPPPTFMAAAPIVEQPEVDRPRAETPADPPMGGPSPEEQVAPASVTLSPRKRGSHAAPHKTRQEEIRRARAARLAHLARERRAAARKARAAQAHAKQQTARPTNSAPFGSFGDSGAKTWSTDTFGINTIRR